MTNETAAETKALVSSLTDTLTRASYALAILILALSVWWLYSAPALTAERDQQEAHRLLYESVVGGGLVPMFVAFITAKFGVTAAVYLFRNR